jgi:CheY-like chemotaxis protein
LTGWWRSDSCRWRPWPTPQYRAGEAAILDQQLAGIDVITGGEMHRRTHNRHAPPNAMLNHFWQKIPAFQGSTKPKPITPYDPNVFHPAATCRSRIADNIDLGLVDEFKTVSALASKPVKITMTGPHTAALEVLDRRSVDLLFTDVVMPGMNGRELADAAVRRRSGLKVLFTTGYTRNAIVHHGRLDAGVQMIGKPYTFDELGAQVRALLDG